MKTLKSTWNVFVSTVCFVTVLTSCSEDNEPDLPNDGFDTAEIIAASEIDAMEVELENLVIEFSEFQEASETGRFTQPPQLPECVSVNIVLEQNFREVTLDFGSEGCLIRGHLLRGKLIFSWTRNPEVQQRLITYALEDFFFDAKSIEGSKTLLRELSNENGNPQFTHTVDLTVTWPNGLQASRAGVKIREWVEGFGSGVFSDNVFEITGNWTTTFVNGNSHTYEVLTPLRREVICAYFVSGTVAVQRTNFGGVLDYGTGDCDNLATFQLTDGETIEIVLD